MCWILKALGGFSNARKTPPLTKHTYKQHFNYATNSRFGEPGCRECPNPPQVSVGNGLDCPTPRLKHRSKTKLHVPTNGTLGAASFTFPQSAQVKPSVIVATVERPNIFNRIMLLFAHSIWRVFLSKPVFFYTIMLLFCKAILVLLLWQHWWFLFFLKISMAWL